MYVLTCKAQTKTRDERAAARAAMKNEATVKSSKKGEAASQPTNNKRRR
jgi:hypothetical protein